MKRIKRSIWELYKVIDKSIIFDLFYAYYGEKWTCLKCKKTFFMIELIFIWNGCKYNISIKNK